MNEALVTKKISWAKPVFFGNEKAYLLNALESTWISGGSYVERLEKEFSSVINAKYGITTSNGTTALQLALLALDIKQGDEIIVPAYGFVAPVNMTLEVGAKPVFADVDPKTWCIDAKEVERCITECTKAVFCIHTYGNICDMPKIMEVAKKNSLYVIEDSAEAAFSKIKGRYAGTYGDIGCFSFQATKTISTGEGGFVCTQSKDLHDTMRLIRNHGMNKDKRYWHERIGYNFRLTNLQAALGCAQLEKLDLIKKERARVYNQYCKRLDGISGIVMQEFRKNVDPVVWAIAIKIDQAAFPLQRDDVISALKEKGIETRPGFYTCYEMPAYSAPQLPIAQDVAERVISLPSYPALTNEEIDYVCDELRKLAKTR